MPFVRHARPLPLSAVRIDSPFWRRWQDRLAAVTLGIQYRQMVETGRLENFRRAARGEVGTHEGKVYNDSDVYKWVEAAAALRHVRGPDPDLDAQLEEVVGLIVGAQAPDGYLNTYFQVQHPEWKWRNLSDLHELYCLGHLYEAAAALAEATGDRRLVEVARRSLAHVGGVFGPDRRAGYCGHPEFELAVFRLCPHLPTAEAHAAESLVRWMLEIRGRRPTVLEAEHRDGTRVETTGYVRTALGPNDPYDGRYFQDHAPIRETDAPVGHAVRAMYLYAGATDAAVGRDDAELEAALLRIYDRLVERQMYVTGGIGSVAAIEGFAEDHTLPNRTAYAETCAACGLVFWSHRLAMATGEGRYVDVLERALFNGALAGIDGTGERFFYVNPLASDGSHHRQPWFDCACCPPNIARLIASVGRYAVARTEDGWQIDLPFALEARDEVDGVPVTLTIRSDYPAAGEVRIEVGCPRPVEFEIRFRIPEWCPEMEVDDPADAEWDYDRDYAVQRRRWKDGDQVTFRLEMPVRLLQAHPAVEAARGRRAVQRGPLVYCLEQADLGAPPASFVLNAGGDWTEEDRTIGDEPVVAIGAEGWLEAWPDAQLLYSDTGLDRNAVHTWLVPYYAWDNRTSGGMEVWLRADR